MKYQDYLIINQFTIMTIQHNTYILQFYLKVMNCILYYVIERILSEKYLLGAIYLILFLLNILFIFISNNCDTNHLNVFSNYSVFVLLVLVL